MSDIAQVLGGLVLLLVGVQAIIYGVAGAVLNSWGSPSSGQVIGSWFIFFGGIGVGLFVIYLSLLSLEPLVRFSFINY